MGTVGGKDLLQLLRRDAPSLIEDGEDGLIPGHTAPHRYWSRCVIGGVQAIADEMQNSPHKHFGISPHHVILLREIVTQGTAIGAQQQPGALQALLQLLPQREHRGIGGQFIAFHRAQAIGQAQQAVAIPQQHLQLLPQVGGQHFLVSGDGPDAGEQIGKGAAHGCGKRQGILRGKIQLILCHEAALLFRQISTTSSYHKLTALSLLF